MKKQFYGCYPTMITPFTSSNKVDYEAIRKMVNWYIDHGADGIFAVCLSSEMFHLSEDEKIHIAQTIIDENNHRIKIVASGHTADKEIDQLKQLEAMSRLDIDALVLVSNRLAKKDEDDAVLEKNYHKIISTFPEVTFGMYECPYPYQRLLSTPFLSQCGSDGSLTFLKDVSCSLKIQEQRVQAVSNSSLSLFNANTSTLLDSLIMGYDGYNGVMANFHIDIYKWLYLNYKKDPEKAREVSDFLTITGVAETRAYPMNAKYHFNETDIPMDIMTRSKDMSFLNENALHEVASLIRSEKRMREYLSI